MDGISHYLERATHFLSENIKNIEEVPSSKWYRIGLLLFIYIWFVSHLLLRVDPADYSLSRIGPVVSMAIMVGFGIAMMVIKDLPQPEKGIILLIIPLVTVTMDSMIITSFHMGENCSKEKCLGFIQSIVSRLGTADSKRETIGMLGTLLFSLIAFLVLLTTSGRNRQIREKEAIARAQAQDKEAKAQMEKRIRDYRALRKHKLSNHRVRMRR